VGISLARMRARRQAAPANSDCRHSDGASYRADALNRIQIVRTNINRDFQRSALMTFNDLVEHYRQTELLADNKTEKTRTHILGLSQKLDSSVLGETVPAQHEACSC
jgi:hypothetical protein